MLGINVIIILDIWWVKFFVLTKRIKQDTIDFNLFVNEGKIYSVKPVFWSVSFSSMG